MFTEDEDIMGKSVTGGAFARLSRTEQEAFLGGSESACFSRAEPRHKQDIVRLLKSLGHVVAMTGTLSQM